LAVIVGKADPTGATRSGRDQGKGLAGKSTLNRLELTPAGADANSRYKKITANLHAVQQFFVEAFLAQHDSPPERIVLDLDAADDPLHGHQLGKLFHGYYDCYCYLPLYVFCGDHPLLALLRPADIDEALGTVKHLARIVAGIRRAWSGVKIVIRADSGFCREAILAWCERNGVDHVIGLPKNSDLPPFPWVDACGGTGFGRVLWVVCCGGQGVGSRVEEMSSRTLEEHYGLLLGLDASWRVVEVRLSLEEQRVELELTHRAGTLCCPECGTLRAMHDRSPARQWRHLDTTQFETVIVAPIPRTDCPTCGVKQVQVPWAEPQGRFTLLFEAFAIRVLEASSNLQRACRLLGLSWKSAQEIMTRAVERGLERRSMNEVFQVGLDEKSFGRGQDYVSVLTDIDGRRLLDVAPRRDEGAATALLETLPADQREQVVAAAIDMSAAYANSIEARLPRAEIVHDRFHIAKHLNEAVDQVRRSQHKELRAEGDFSLKQTKHLLMYHPDHLDDEQREWIEALKDAELKTARAWAIREHSRWSWTYTYAGNAATSSDQWHAWAIRCRLPPIVRVVQMLKRHLLRILTWFRHPISNGPAEGFNSVIQSLKSAARGFRNFANYRTRILFFTGKLQLIPETGT
jgi:transposase